MMMKKKFVAVALSAVCLLSAVSCGQQSASTASSASSVSSSVASSASASQVMDAEDYLSGISGTYVELFPEMAKSEYRNLWIDAATPLVGEDNAESATDMLLGMCMAEPYVVVCVPFRRRAHIAEQTVQQGAHHFHIIHPYSPPCTICSNRIYCNTPVSILSNPNFPGMQAVKSSMTTGRQNPDSALQYPSSKG